MSEEDKLTLPDPNTWDGDDVMVWIRRVNKDGVAVPRGTAVFKRVQVAGKGFIWERVA